MYMHMHYLNQTLMQDVAETMRVREACKNLWNKKNIERGAETCKNDTEKKREKEIVK